MGPGPDFMANSYCDQLGIDVPDLAEVCHHREASAYSLLITALLEHGAPMTLAEVADRLDTVGYAPADQVLASLKRCRPGRPPIYRDGDLYAPDIHDDELDLWVFRLGLRPTRFPRLRLLPKVEPARNDDQPLTAKELDEAFGQASLSTWSKQRVVLAVLDAASGPLSMNDIVTAIASRTAWHPLKFLSEYRPNRNAPIERSDDHFSIRDHTALPPVRRAVRERVAMMRRYAAERPSPEVLAASRSRHEQRRADTDAELATLRTAILVAFPEKAPVCLTIADVRQRQLTTAFAEEFRDGLDALEHYDVLAGENIRTTLRALGIDASIRRVAELGPPQKTMRISKSGRTLKITNTLLVAGSCGISRPFGDRHRMDTYLKNGDRGKLVRRLEADAKSLVALYQYGLLHHFVRLTWGFLDERIPAPWAPRTASCLNTHMATACASGKPLVVVAGHAPNWDAPWKRARPCTVRRSHHAYGYHLLDDQGNEIDSATVQLARFEEEY